MGDSILNDIKKLLGITSEYNAFDRDIILHINSVLMALVQIGIGKKGFIISTSYDTWDEFLDDAENLEAVKSYVALRVRMLFDPPTNSSVASSFENQIQMYEWRLYMEAESERRSENE